MSWIFPSQLYPAASCLLASKKGEKIPLEWATDKTGRPTDDPDEAFKGFLLPAGGYKGLGIAYAVEILTGVLCGGVLLDAMKGMYKYPEDPSLTSHLMMAINISAIMEPDELKNRMDEFTQKIHASPMWDETQEMLIPGEIEYRYDATTPTKWDSITRKLILMN